MDALLLIDTDDTGFTSQEAIETLGGIVGRTRAVGGVLIFASTKEELADREDAEISVYGPDEEDLVLRSDNPDIFEGVEDLAAGLHDMAVDRIVIAGLDDDPGAVWASAMAGLVCNFDVIVLSDSVIDADGVPVAWMAAAEEAGAMVKRTEDTWLRM